MDDKRTDTGQSVPYNLSQKKMDDSLLDLVKEMVRQNSAIVRMNEQTLNLINNPGYVCSGDEK